MFIWDFVADTVLGQITDWVYGRGEEYQGYVWQTDYTVHR